MVRVLSAHSIARGGVTPSDEVRGAPEKEPACQGRSLAWSSGRGPTSRQSRRWGSRSAIARTSSRSGRCSTRCWPGGGRLARAHWQACSAARRHRRGRCGRTPRRRWTRWSPSARIRRRRAGPARAILPTGSASCGDARPRAPARGHVEQVVDEPRHVRDRRSITSRDCWRTGSGTPSARRIPTAVRRRASSSCRRASSGSRVTSTPSSTITSKT
jgi:hypothetical protein